MTPREVDINGLSFYLTPPTGKYIMTTVKAVNQTKVLTAIIDGSNHVSVRPKMMNTMAGWIASKQNANESPHTYTLILQYITIDPFGRGR